MGLKLSLRDAKHTPVSAGQKLSSSNTDLKCYDVSKVWNVPSMGLKRIGVSHVLLYLSAGLKQFISRAKDSRTMASSLQGFTDMNSLVLVPLKQ